jgi:DNA-binding transcriptional ArsR family regulator
MEHAADLADLAGLLADGSRCAMLQALMDQRARTATELARVAKVAPSTASRHLSRITDGGLVTVEAQGRNRYYRLANAEVATLLERMMAFTPVADSRPAPKVDFELRFARTCYDHLAGVVATALYQEFLANGTLHAAPEFIAVTPQGSRTLASFGIDVDALGAGRRPLTRTCLDWTERRDHLAGALGAVLLTSFRARNWLAPRRAPRAMRVTDAGREGLAAHFGVDVTALVGRVSHEARTHS